MTKIAMFAAVLCVASACKKKSTEKTAEPPKGSAESGSGSAAAGSGSAAVGSGSADTGSGSAGSAAAAAPWDGKSRLEITGFQTPESAYYDGDQDVYFVSNINGKVLDADDNGFISKVSPDGKIIELKWIDGAKDNITLNAPKGFAKEGGMFWVADIDVVRKFDAKTGEPKGEVKIEGASFLNDVSIDGDGGVYVTDSGLDGNFKPTGTDAVYRITKEGKVSPLVKIKGLAPNGVTPGRNNMRWVVTFGSGELLGFDHKGKKQKAEKLPKGQLDGVVEMDFGSLLISSWEGKAVYRGNPGGPWKAVVENQTSPADIGLDAKRSRLLIPAFQSNTLVIVPIPPE